MFGVFDDNTTDLTSSTLTNTATSDRYFRYQHLKTSMKMKQYLQ